MEYRILGPLEIQANGELIRLGPAKERALLGVLLLHANDVVAGDRLVEELWGDRPPESAGKLVHVYVSRLRKTLEQAGAKPVVETRAPGYVAAVSDDGIDAARFERLVADAHSSAATGDFEAALTTYDAGLGLWRGRVLADVTFESLARNEADRLEESRRPARGCSGRPGVETRCRPGRGRRRKSRSEGGRTAHRVSPHALSALSRGNDCVWTLSPIAARLELMMSARRSGPGSFAGSQPRSWLRSPANRR